MKTTIALFLFTFGLNAAVVHHPAPKKPLYLSEDWYSVLKQKIAPPPEKFSERQKKDEEELFKFQNKRSTKDCERAKSEVFVSLNNFYGSPFGFLNSNEAEALSPFF